MLKPVVAKFSDRLKRLSGSVRSLAFILACPFFWAALILFFHGWLLFAYFVPVMSGVDPDGYHGCARELADHGRLYRLPANDFEFIGRMWVVNQRGQYYPKYPPFYPALAGLAMRWLGPTAGLYVNPVAAWLSGLALLILAWLWLGSATASLLAAFALITNPLFNQLAVRPTSHITSLLFMLLGFVFLWLALRSRQLWLALGLTLAAGLSGAIPTGIRYSDMLLVLPLLALLILMAPARRRWYLVAALMAGMALPWTLLALFHLDAFGAFWRTGYALTGEQTGFAWSYLADNIRFYFGEFVVAGIGPLGIMAVFGLVQISGQSGRQGIIFGLWLIPLFILYLFYYWAPENRAIGFLRFLLPLFIPCILLASDWCSKYMLTQPTRSSRLAVLSAFVLFQGGWGVIESMRGLEPSWHQQIRIRATRDFALEQIPDGAMVIAARGILHTLDFERRWQLYDNLLFNLNRLSREIERTLEPGPSAFQKERAEVLKEQLLDLSTADYRNWVRSLLETQWETGNEVYVLGSEREMRINERLFSNLSTIELVARHEPELPAWRWLASGKPREPGQRPSPTVQAPPILLWRLAAR